MANVLFSDSSSEEEGFRGMKKIDAIFDELVTVSEGNDLWVWFDFQWLPQVGTLRTETFSNFEIFGPADK